MSTPQQTGRARLLCLAIVLFIFSATLPYTGTSRETAPAYLFLSPNTEEGLSLEESLKRITMFDHIRHKQHATHILRELGTASPTIHDALGEWEGGIENSLLVVLPQSPDASTLRHAAAWFGLLAEQKSVLAFRPDPQGHDLLLTVEVEGSLQEVRQLLDAWEMRDRTILPRKFHTRAYIVDAGGKRARAVAQRCEAKNAITTIQRGRSDWLMGATREDARKRYQEVLRGTRFERAKRRCSLPQKQYEPRSRSLDHGSLARLPLSLTPE